MRVKNRIQKTFRKLIACAVSIAFLSTNVTWAGGFSPNEAYKLAIGTRLGDVAFVAEDIYLNDMIIRACVRHGVETNRDILEHGDAIGEALGADEFFGRRCKDVSYGVLGSRSNPEARAFYLINNDVERGKFYVHRYSIPGTVDDPFSRAIGEFIRPEVKMDGEREIGGVRLRHQVFSIPEEVRGFILSLIPLFPGQVVGEQEEPTGISFYRSLVDPSTQASFRSISTWNEYFDVIGRLPANTQEVTIAFDRGRFGSRIFRVKIPHERLLATDPELRDMVFRYLSIYIYNRLGAIGAERVLINHDGKGSLDESPLCYALSERFNFDRSRIQDVYDDSGYPDRAYKLINNYLSMVYEVGFSFEYVDLSEIDTLPAEVEIPQQEFEKDRGEVIGIDIGGSDIKVVAMKNGELTFYEEVKWSPSEFDSAGRHIDMIRRLIDKARDRGGLTKIDSIGISVNLAVNNERITGDGPLLDGIRGNAAEQDKIKGLRDIIAGIYEVPVAVSNDGDMSALWAYQDMGMRNVLCFSMGTGLAGGYVNADGNVTNVTGEMGNVVIDMSAGAAGHSFTKMPGVAQAYLSQRPIIKPDRLAELKGINLFEIAFTRGLVVSSDDIDQISVDAVRKAVAVVDDSEISQKLSEIFTEVGADYSDPASIHKFCKKAKENEIDIIDIAWNSGFLIEKGTIIKLKDAKLLELAQWLLENGDDVERTKCREIFNEIGAYLAAAIVEIHNYFGQREVLIMGRVTRGRGGDIIKARASEILARNYPGLGITIRFPITPSPDKPQDLYKRFGQAIGAAYLGNQKAQNMPEPDGPGRPQTSGRDVRWRSPDAVDTGPGNLDDLEAMLTLSGIESNLIVNFRAGYEEALGIACKRFGRDCTELQQIPLHIVKTLDQAAQIDTDKITIVFETLYCKERVARELVEEFDHAVNNPQTDFDRACHELRTDIEEVLYFHRLPVEKQAEYLASLIGLVTVEPSVQRPVGLDSNEDKDKSFYTLLVRSYRDNDKFQRLIGKLALRHGLSNIDKKVLEDFQAEQAKKQAGIFELCQEYGRNNRIYPVEIQNELRTKGPEEIIPSLVNFYSGLDPKGNFKRNYELLEQGFHGGNKLDMFNAVLEEAIFVGRPVEQIVGGIIDSGVYSREDYDFESARGPPSYEMPSECEMVYIGGGGWHATDFVWVLVRQLDMVKERVPGYMVGGVYATADDGGRGRKFIDQLREHPEYKRYIVNMADLGVVLFWATGEATKLQMIYEDSSVSWIVNVNGPVDLSKADQVELYRDTLMKIYSMEEELADEIIEYKREQGDFDSDSFNTLLSGYFTGKFTAQGMPSGDIGEKAENAAQKIAERVRFQGKFLMGFEDIIAERIPVLRRMMRQQRPYRQRGYYGRPEDIMFFISNILNMARLCDREFVDKNIRPLLKASTMNLFNFGALLACGIVEKGKGGNPARIIADNKRTLDLFHEALGVNNAHLAPSTLNEGTLATVMEAVSVKIGDDVVIIGEEEGKMWLTQVPPDHYRKFDTVHLNSEGRQEVTASGVDMNFNVYDEQGTRVDTVRVRFIKGEGRDVIIKVSEADEEMILTETDQEGMTVVRIGDMTREVNTVAKWEPYQFGETIVEVRSRLVIEQTAITDAEEAYPVHPAPPVRQVWKRVMTDEGGNVVYAEDERGEVIRDNGTRRRVYRDLESEEEIPKATPEAVKTIKGARKVIVSGMGSMFTSILPNFMCRGIAQEVKKRNDIARVYVVKTVTDIETAGLSIREQMLRFERTVQGIPGSEDIKLEDLYSHVVLPNVPRNLREHLLGARDRFLEDLQREAAEEGGKPKLSKIPFDVQEVTDEDRAFFRERGIKTVEVSNFTEHRKIKKGEVAITSSIHYDPEELVNVLDMIGDSYSLERRMEGEGLVEAAQSLFPEDVSFPREPLFWSMHMLHDVFAKFKSDAQDNPGKYDPVVVTLDRGESGSVVYRLSIPKSLSDRESRLVARYIAIYIYNRLATLGAKRVLVRCRTQLFNAIRDRFRDSNLGKIFKFLGDVYNTEFQFVVDTALRTSEAIPAVGPEPLAEPGMQDPKRGMLMGISVGEEEIRWTILKDGQVRHDGVKKWTRYEIKNAADFHNLLHDVITGAISNLGRDARIDCIGIAWPGPVREGKIPATTYLLPELSEQEFREGIFPLGEVISKRLDEDKDLPEYQGVPVVVVNDGNAQGFREMVETGEKDFLAIGMRGSTPASLVKDGRLVDVLSEVGNVHIDMSMGAARHRVTNVSGAMQQYLTKEGVRRLGQKLLMGDISYGEIEEVFGYIVEDVIKDKGDAFASLGMTPVELYVLCDYYSKLQEPSTPYWKRVDLLKKFVKRNPAERLIQILGVGPEILERIKQNSADRSEIEMLRGRIREKVEAGACHSLIDSIANEISRNLAEELVQLHKQYRMGNILLPTHILGETIGELVCNKTEAILIESGLTPGARVFLKEKLTYSDVIDRLEKGDPQAKRVFEIIGEYLAEAIEELHATFGPKKVIIYGDIIRGNVRDVVFGVVRTKLRERGEQRRRLGISGESEVNLEAMEIVPTTLDWTFVGQGKAMGAAYLANDRIMPPQLLVERLLTEHREAEILDSYRAEDKVEARMVMLQKLRTMLKSERGELRERSRVALGRIIGIPIQDMFARQDRAHEVRNRYLEDEGVKVDGISRKMLMKEIIESCLLEPRLTNVWRGANWVMSEVRKQEEQGAAASGPKSEAPNMTVYWSSEPHGSINADLKNEHERGNTYFIIRGKLYKIKFAGGEPVTDAQGRYELEEFEDKSLLDTLNKVNTAMEVYISRLDSLLEELNIPPAERPGMRGRFEGLAIPVFRGRFLLGEEEGVMAHASGTAEHGLRWGDQISFGDLIIDFLAKEDLAELMIEETKHLIFPERHHASADNPDGIKHSFEFRRDVSGKIEEYLLHLDERKLHELYRRRKMHRLRGAPWLDLYLSTWIVKSRRLRSAMEEARAEFDKPGYTQDKYFEVIESVFAKCFTAIESLRAGTTEENIKDLVQYYRAIDPRFGQNWDFVRRVKFGNSDFDTFMQYLETAERLKIPFGQVVCGIVQCEEVQRPLDVDTLKRLARAPPKRTRYAYIGGGGWTPTDFAWALTRNRGIIESCSYPTIFTAITNTQDDGGRSRSLADRIRDLWDLDTIAAGDGVVLAWLTGVVAKLDLLYRNGDFSRVFNINRLTKDAVDQKGRKLVDLLYRPIKDVLDRDTYNRFIDKILETNREVKAEHLEGFVKAKLAEAKIGTIDMKKEIDPVWEGLKSQLMTDGPHILSVEDTIKNRIEVAEESIREGRSIGFHGRDFGEYEEPADWLYFLGNVLDMARMTDEELVRPEISVLRNLSWMNSYTTIGQLDAGVIQPGNRERGIQGRLVSEIGFQHFCDMFGIEHGYWAPSTFDKTIMATVMEGISIRINNKTAVIGTNEEGEMVVGFVKTDKQGSIITTKTERLSYLTVIPQSPAGVRKRFGREYVNFRVNEDGKVVIRVKSYEIVLGEYKEGSPEHEEGRTTYILGAGPREMVRTDARWHEVVEGIEIKSRLVEEQNRITDTEEPHPSPVYKLIWKKIKKDEDGEPMYDQFGNRVYRDITPEERPIADKVMLELLDNVDCLVFTGQSSLVTSTIPNYLVVGIIDKLRELKKRGLPIIYMVKPMKDIETGGLTFGEQIRVWERSIQESIGDSNFRIGEILSGIIIPDLDALPGEVRREYAKAADAKMQTYPRKLPYVGPDKPEKLSKIMPMDPLDIGYKKKNYGGKAVDTEVLAELQVHGVAVMWTTHLRVFMGKYVYDEERLIEEFEEIGMSEKWRRGHFKRITDFIAEFEAHVAGLDADQRQKVTVAYRRGRYGTDTVSWDIPVVTAGIPEDELNRIVEYLKYNIYNRLGVYGAGRILVDAPDLVFEKLTGIFNTAPFNHIYPYQGMVYRTEFRIERATHDQITALVLESAGVTEPEFLISEDPREGSYIGVDVGGTGIKVVVRKGAEIVFQTEYPWQPEELADPSEYFRVITESIDDAMEAAGLVRDSLEGIGISWHGAVVSGDITGRALVDKRLTNEQFQEGITPLREFIALRYTVPVSIVNNGDAMALHASVDTGLKNVLCLGLDERLASSYVDRNGLLTSWLNELGNVVIDTHPGAARHFFSRVRGTLQRYLSQEGVFKLAELHQVNLFGIEDKLGYIQGLLNSEDPDLQRKAKAVFVEVGAYLATAIAVLYPIYGMDHVVISGKCVIGEAGAQILESAQEVLAASYPEVDVTILLPFEDEPTLDYANVIGASYSAFHEATKLRKYVVAIDGPSGVGKGTVAKEIAKRMKLNYLDTGGIYRAITYYLLQQGIIHEYDAGYSPGQLSRIADALTEINLEVILDGIENRFMLGGSDVSSLLRAIQVSQMVPRVAKVEAVRDKVNAIQRRLAQDKGIVVDGRDTTTIGFPDADRKIYLYASPKVRADRRYDQYRAAGEDVEHDAVYCEMMARDEVDMGRTIAPLMRPDEAEAKEDILFLDNSQLNEEQTIERMMDLILLGREGVPGSESPRRHSGADSVAGETLSTITIDEAGNIVDIEVRKSTPEYEDLFNRDLLQEELGELLRLYGPGLLGVTKEIEVVDGDALSFYNTKVQIGIKRFAKGAELFEGLEHEFLESITTLIQPNRGYGEATVLYRNIKRFLNPVGFDKEEYQREILEGFSERYRAMLKRLLELERAGELTDRKIISAIVRYILSTESYRDSWKDFGMDEATWHEAVRATEGRLEAALEVYDDLARARGLEPVEPIEEKVVKGVKRTERAVLRRIKTFTGKTRIEGLDRLPQAIGRAIDVLREIAEATVDIKVEAVAAIEARVERPKKYIWLDKDKEDGLADSVRREWDKIKDELLRNDFQFVYERPEGVALNNVIRLVDPADLGDLEHKTDILYLSLPYMRASLYLAAEVVLAEGDADRLKDTIAIRLIAELYEQLLGKEITRDDLIKLFREPWFILSEIKEITGDLNRLQEAAGLYDVAA